MVTLRTSNELLRQQLSAAQIGSNAMAAALSQTREQLALAELEIAQLRGDTGWQVIANHARGCC